MAVSFSGALRWAFVMNVGQHGMYSLLTLVLAALLGPEAYGLVAMALVYLEIFQLFLGQGISSALIQRAQLEPADLDTAFWLVLASTAGLVLVAAAAAPAWATFNGEPELGAISLALLPMLVFKGLAVVHMAVLQRRMDFQSLAIRSNAAVLLGGIAGLSFAIAGYGAWSLVAQQVLTSCVETTLLWWLSDFRPRARFSFRVARELQGFGRKVLLDQIGVFVARRSDALVLGYFFGPVALALYRMADRLAQLGIELSRPVAQVAMPNFARLKTDPDALREGVITALKTTSVLTIPALVGLAAVSEPLIGLLGEEWHGAAPVLQILCALGIARGLTLQTGALLQAVGRPGLMAAMTWALAAANLIGFTLAGFWLRSSADADQIRGVAFVRTGIFALLYAPAYLAMLIGFSGVRWRQSLRAVAPSVWAALAVIAAVVAARTLADAVGLPAAASLAAQVALGAAAGIATLYVADAQFVLEHAGALRRWTRRRPTAHEAPPLQGDR